MSDGSLIHRLLIAEERMPVIRALREAENRVDCYMQDQRDRASAK